MIFFSFYYAYRSWDHTNKKLEKETHIYKLYLVSVLNYNSTQKNSSDPKQKILSLQITKSRTNISNGLYNRQLSYVVYTCSCSFTWHQLGHQRAWHQRSLLDAGYQHTSSFAHDCAHLFPPKERDVKSFAGINNILICKMLTSWHYHNLYCMGIK